VKELPMEIAEDGPKDAAPRPAPAPANTPVNTPTNTTTSTPTPATTTTTASSEGPQAWLVILLSGLGVIGLAGLGCGIWMLVGSGNKKPRRRRRSRDYD
jgi:hypothetical protein